MIYTAIVETASGKNVRDIEASTAREAAMLAVKKNNCNHGKEATATLLQDPTVRAHRDRHGNVSAFNVQGPSPKSPGQAHTKPLPELVATTIKNGLPVDGFNGHDSISCEQAARVVLKNPTDYPLIFCEWLVLNWRTWADFVRVSDSARHDKGFKHWSAFAVAAVLRWESDTTDTTGDFKVNNNYLPYLARLYNAVHDTDFFRTKGKSKP